MNYEYNNETLTVTFPSDDYLRKRREHYMYKLYDEHPHFRGRYLAWNRIRRVLREAKSEKELFLAYTFLSETIRTAK